MSLYSELRGKLNKVERKITGLGEEEVLCNSFSNALSSSSESATSQTTNENDQADKYTVEGESVASLGLEANQQEFEIAAVDEVTSSDSASEQSSCESNTNTSDVSIQQHSNPTVEWIKWFSEHMPVIERSLRDTYIAQFLKHQILTIESLGMNIARDSSYLQVKLEILNESYAEILTAFALQNFEAIRPWIVNSKYIGYDIINTHHIHREDKHVKSHQSSTHTDASILSKSPKSMKTLHNSKSPRKSFIKSSPKGIHNKDKLINSLITKLDTHTNKLNAIHTTVIDTAINMEKLKSFEEHIESMLHVSLIGGYDHPVVAALIPDFEGNKTWKETLKTPYLRKDKYWLFYFCEHTRRIAPCGPEGKGYLIEISNKYVRSLTPYLKLGLTVLQEVLRTAHIPVPLMPVIDALGQNVDINKLYTEHASKHFNDVLQPNTSTGSKHTSIIDNNTSSSGKISATNNSTYNNTNSTTNSSSKNNSTHISNNFLHIPETQDEIKLAYDAMKPLLELCGHWSDIKRTCGLICIIQNKRAHWILPEVREDFLRYYSNEPHKVRFGAVPIKKIKSFRRVTSPKLMGEAAAAVQRQQSLRELRTSLCTDSLHSCTKTSPNVPPSPMQKYITAFVSPFKSAFKSNKHEGMIDGHPISSVICWSCCHNTNPHAPGCCLEDGVSMEWSHTGEFIFELNAGMLFEAIEDYLALDITELSYYKGDWIELLGMNDRGKGRFNARIVTDLGVIEGTIPATLLLPPKKRHKKIISSTSTTSSSSTSAESMSTVETATTTGATTATASSSACTGIATENITHTTPTAVLHATQTAHSEHNTKVTANSISAVFNTLSIDTKPDDDEDDE